MGEPQLGFTRPVSFPIPSDPRPQPTFAMVGATHFSRSLSADRVWPGGTCLLLQGPLPISDVPTPTSRNSPWRPTHQRPKGEVGAVGATFGLHPTLTAEGACTAAAGIRVRRQGTLLRRSGGRSAPGAPIGWGRGHSASPATRRAQRLPDPTGRGRTGCPASVPPHQAEGGGRRGNLGSSGPPLSNHFPKL